MLLKEGDMSWQESMTAQAAFPWNGGCTPTGAFRASTLMTCACDSSDGWITAEGSADPVTGIPKKEASWDLGSLYTCSGWFGERGERGIQS